MLAGHHGEGVQSGTVNAVIVADENTHHSTINRVLTACASFTRHLLIIALNNYILTKY
jgi:hypothetical protein